MIWLNDERVFHNGKRLKIGKWFVGTVEYESRNKGEKNHYAAKTELPGLKPVLDYYLTEHEAMKRVERAVKYWIYELNNI